MYVCSWSVLWEELGWSITALCRCIVLFVLYSVHPQTANTPGPLSHHQSDEAEAATFQQKELASATPKKEETHYGQTSKRTTDKRLYAATYYMTQVRRG